MSLVQMYIQQLQYSPHTFIFQIEDMSNETLLELLLTTFYSNIQIFDSIIHFCGQESIKYRDLHPYNKVLNVLRDRHIASFQYVCLKLLSGMLIFQLDNNTELINITISNLCVYPEILHNALLFLNHKNKMNQLLDLIKTQKELLDYLIKILFNIDLELSNYIQEYCRVELPKPNNIEDKDVVDNNNNVEDVDTVGNSNNNVEDVDTVGNSNNNVEDVGIIGNSINNEELDIEELEEENNIINQTLNDKISTVDEFDSYIDSLEEDKKAIISVIKTTDNDRFIVQASDFEVKKKKVDPSVKIFTKCLNKDILYKTSLTRITRLQLTNIEHILRDETDNNIIFCDGMNLLYCNITDSYSPCSTYNPYRDRFEYIKDKINLTKAQRIQNLNVWIELFNNIKYQKNDNMSDSGYLLDKYTVVITVQNYIFDKLFGASSPNNINMAVENNIVILGIGNNEADDYLLYYLLMKFGRPTDILFTNDNYEWVQHNLKFFINNKTMEIKDFDTNKKSDYRLLTSDFNNTHQGYTFSL